MTLTPHLFGAASQAAQGLDWLLKKLQPGTAAVLKQLFSGCMTLQSDGFRRIVACADAGASNLRCYDISINTDSGSRPVAAVAVLARMAIRLLCDIGAQPEQGMQDDHAAR